MSDPHDKCAERLRSAGWSFGALLVSVGLFLGGVALAPRLTERSAARVTETASPLPLAHLIRHVKEELTLAGQQMIDKHEVPLIKLENVELDLSFVVESSGSTDIQLLAVEGDATVRRENVQRIRIEMGPVGAAGRPDVEPVFRRSTGEEAVHIGPKPPRAR